MKSFGVSSSITSFGVKISFSESYFTEDYPCIEDVSGCVSTRDLFDLVSDSVGANLDLSLLNLLPNTIV